MPVLASKSKVCFFFQGVHPTLENRTGLKTYILSLFKREKRMVGALNYIFGTDKALLEINRNYLKHNYYTDIITFDLSEGPEIQADIFISIDRVRENASKLGVTFKEELHRVIFHGALHLCGYKDKTKKDVQAMRRMEEHHLQEYLKRST